MKSKYKYIESYVIEELYKNIENNNTLDEYKDNLKIEKKSLILLLYFQMN